MQRKQSKNDDEGYEGYVASIERQILRKITFRVLLEGLPRIRQITYTASRTLTVRDEGHGVINQSPLSLDSHRKSKAFQRVKRKKGRTADPLKEKHIYY